MYCHYCKNQIANNSAQCPYCGTIYHAPVNPVFQQPPSPGSIPPAPPTGYGVPENRSQSQPGYPSQGHQPQAQQAAPPPHVAPGQSAYHPVIPVQPAPHYQQSMPAVYTEPGYAPAIQSPKATSSIESWVGRNVIGIIASVLVFLGMLFLGFLVIPSLGDGFKIALMFILSIVLVAAGTTLTLIKKNNFTVTLLGTGSGSLFISIMVTHAFFHAISDVVAFVLLLLWLAGVLVLVKVSDSLLLSIIAHAGMIVSLCFAYAIGMSQDKLPLILAYHALSVAFIIIGNKICYEKTFRMGLFVSLFMSFVAVLTMYFYYVGTSVRMDALQLGIVTAAFVLQFIGALVISGFLIQSTSQIKDKSNRILVFVFNLALAFGVIYITTYLFPLLIASLGSSEMQLLGFIPSYPVMVAVTTITTLITLAYGFGCIVLQKKLKLDSAFEHIVIIAGCSYITFQLLSLYILTLISYTDAIRIPWLVLIALVLAVCFAATKNRIYALTACIVLAFDMFLMLVGGYASLVAFGTIFSGFAYLGISLAILTYFWTQLDPERKSALLTPFKIAVLLVSELSVISIFLTGGISVVYALLLIALTFLVFFVTKFEAAGSNQRGFWSFMRVHEVILVVINAFYIADSVAIGLAKIPYLLLSMVSVTLLGLTLYRISKGSETKKWLGVFVGIGLTLITVASVGGLTSWLDEPYVLSLVWMATALVCILAGFFLRVKPLRLYGLIVIIGCVLKLVILDIGAAATLMRVIALIVGGLICFGISALYSYAAKRFDAAPTNNGPVMPVVGKLSVPVGNVPAAPNGYTSPASGDNAPAISADNGQNTRV